MAVDLNMQILIVDDYKTMLRIVRNLLKQLGFDNVDEAADGSEALSKLRGRPYGLVISDWNMEPMTGYQLLKEVRSDTKLAETPFIMVTAESKSECSAPGSLDTSLSHAAVANTRYDRRRYHVICPV